ncbi:hypothetical protein AVEN_26529-1 [Araneus ventricosus]|uniref:Uncharacterized protein n=1 Tax=Araneus ventricosus TaxID=182803 RepID=A0A4Y2JZ74_ARAVE|nr:hypothetical protein AVEN_26529-1 [Araneus ventricosus]
MWRSKRCNNTKLDQCGEVRGVTIRNWINMEGGEESLEASRFRALSSSENEWLRWPGGKVPTLEPKDSRFETRFREEPPCKRVWRSSSGPNSIPPGPNTLPLVWCRSLEWGR